MSEIMLGIMPFFLCLAGAGIAGIIIKILREEEEVSDDREK